MNQGGVHELSIGSARVLVRFEWRIILRMSTNWDFPDKNHGKALCDAYVYARVALMVIVKSRTNK